MTLSHFADVVGVSKPTVWAWENGKCRPRTHRVAAIATALGIDPEELTDAALARRSADDVSALNIASANVIEECRQRIAASFGTKAALVRIIIEV
jgi:transcriptional regulator with XRE-family HTH domain